MQIYLTILCMCAVRFAARSGECLGRLCVGATMAEDGGKKLLKFPFPISDEQKAALVDLHHTLVENSELKCKAITLKNLVTTPSEGVKFHSVRAVVANFDLLDIIAPYLSQTLEIRKVAVLQWLFESVGMLNWKAWVGKEGLRGYAIARSKFPCKDFAF